MMINILGASKKARLAQIGQAMENASDYGAWRELAEQHDELSGANDWKRNDQSRMYDAVQIKHRYNRLKRYCSLKNNEQVLFALNEGIHGNMGGMGKSALYKRSKLGTKKLISDYVELIAKALRQVADAPQSEIPFDEKLDFFRRASHCFGRSALTMSGGAGLVYFHHGVVQSLLNHDLLPNVISGSSAGAWMCAQLGTLTDKELETYFLEHRYATENISRISAIGLLSLNAEKDKARAHQRRNELIDSFASTMTFQEAFEHTGRYINISIAPAERHQNSRLMNAITSPNVTIRSAAMASSTLPGLLEPSRLEAKDSRGKLKPYLRSRGWVDGSISDDLPFKRLSRLFGVNHFIVSMINPLVLSFVSNNPRPKHGSLSESASALFHTAVKESLKTVKRWASPTRLDKVDTWFSSLYQLMDQSYSGDINIMMDRKHIRLRKMLFSYKNDAEIEELILDGQQATWPKLDQIKNATYISRVIDDILLELEQDAVNYEHRQHKVHMTV